MFDDKTQLPCPPLTADKSPMSMVSKQPKNCRAIVRHAEFRNDHGRETYVSATVERPAGFREAVGETLRAYESCLADLGLDLDTEIYIKIYLSNVENQIAVIREYLEERSTGGLVFVIGQAPVQGRYIAVEAYHLESAGVMEKRRTAKGNIEICHNNFTSVWRRHIPTSAKGPYDQSESVITDLISSLDERKSSLKDNVLRTWYFVRDIDNNYGEMVECRKKHYEARDLTPETHFIASTGIEARAEEPDTLVWMYSITTDGLKEEQVSFMSAPEHMSPTHVYGVNFERGTVCSYGDRKHMYISGTASIDKHGDVLHVNDVHRQTQRAIENIEAMLINEGTDLSALKTATVYLRDASDYELVLPVLEERLGNNLAYVVVVGPVCRPTWLVEIEGIAIVENDDDKFETYC